MATRWEHSPHFRGNTFHPIRFEYWTITPGLVADLSGALLRPRGPKSWKCHIFARKFSPTALDPLLRLLPLPEAPTPEAVDRMAEQWASPEAVSLPQGVPGAGRAEGSYLEVWRGQVEEDKRGGEKGGGSNRGGTAPVLSPEEELLFGKALAVKPGGRTAGGLPVPIRDPFLLAPLWGRYFEGQPQDGFSIHVYAGSVGYSPASLPPVFQGATTIFWKVGTPRPASPLLQLKEGTWKVGHSRGLPRLAGFSSAVQKPSESPPIVHSVTPLMLILCPIAPSSLCCLVPLMRARTRAGTSAQWKARGAS